MDRKYNSIYNKLVQSDKDLVGLVAYAIYKRHKIEFVSGVKRSKNREPTDEECEVFFAASMADSQINKYRSEAKTLLSEVVANTKKEEIEQFEAEMLSNYQENIKNCLPPWWQNVLWSVIASFIFSGMGLFFYYMGVSEKGESPVNEVILRIETDSTTHIGARMLPFQSEQEHSKR